MKENMQRKRGRDIWVPMICSNKKYDWSPGRGRKRQQAVIIFE